MHGVCLIFETINHKPETITPLCMPGVHGSGLHLPANRRPPPVKVRGQSVTVAPELDPEFRNFKFFSGVSESRKTNCI